jgi:DNA (cytosine-5)-methyltransferase 1
MTRCDLSTYHECSCHASGVPCKVQAPLDLGVFTGTNHPGPLDGYPETARNLNGALILLSIIVFAIIIGLGAQAGPINVYTCWTFVVRAGDIGANHERPRSWLIGCDLAQVADTDGVGRHERWRGRWSGLDLSVSEDPRDADDKIDTSLIRIFGGKSTVTDRGIARDLAHPDQAGQAGQAGQADGCMVPGVRQEEITDDGRGAGRGDAGPSIGQMAVRTADCGRVAEWRTDWSLDDLAAHLQLDDGLSAWVAGTRIAVGGPKGTSAASLIVEAFGDAVVPQIPEAIGRAILRTERALAEVYGRGATTRTRDTDNG